MSIRHLNLKLSMLFVSLILLVSCSSKEKQVNFDRLVDAMHESSLKAVDSDSSISSTAFAYIPEDSMFYIGIVFKDDELPSSEEQLRVYEALLSKAGEVSLDNDWRSLLRDYNVTFEQLYEKDGNKRMELAIKKEDSDRIELTR